MIEPCETISNLIKEYQYAVLIEENSYNELSCLLKKYGISYINHLENDYKWKEVKGCDQLFLKRLNFLMLGIQKKTLNNIQLKKEMNYLFKLFYEIKKANQDANNHFRLMAEKRFQMLSTLNKDFDQIFHHCLELSLLRKNKYTRFENLWNQSMVKLSNVEKYRKK